MQNVTTYSPVRSILLAYLPRQRVDRILQIIRGMFCIHAEGQSGIAVPKEPGYLIERDAPNCHPCCGGVPQDVGTDAS